MSTTTTTNDGDLIDLAVALLGFSVRPANVNARCDAISQALEALPDTDDLATEERRLSLMIERSIIYGISHEAAFPGAHHPSRDWSTWISGVISIRLERAGTDRQIALDTADRIVSAVRAISRSPDQSPNAPRSATPGGGQ